MANAKLILHIAADDRATPVLQRLHKEANRTGIAGIAAGNMVANAFGSVVSGSIQAATSAVRGFGAALKGAADLELTILTAAAGLSKMGNMSLAASTGVITGLQTQLSKDVRDLAGSSSLYLSIMTQNMDEFSSVAKDASGNLDQVLLKNRSLSVSKSLGILTASTPTLDQNGNDANRFYAQFMGGATMGSLRQLDFVQQGNANFRNALTAEMAKVNNKNLTPKQRDELLQRAFDAANLDVIATESANTMAGIWEGFVGRFFDPYSGTFGFMRDFDEMTAGSQTAFQGFKAVAISLFSDKGLFGALADLAKVRGIADPMQGLAEGLSSMAAFFNRITRIVKRFTSEGVDIGSILGRTFTEIATGFANWIGGVSESFTAFVDSQEFASFGDRINFGAIGAALASLVNLAMTGFIGAIRLVFANGNWLEGLLGFIGAVDWGSVAKIMTMAIVGALIAGVVGLAGFLLTGLLTTAAGVALTAVGTLFGLGTGLSALLATTLTPIVAPFVGMIGGGLLVYFAATVQTLFRAALRFRDWIEDTYNAAGRLLSSSTGSILSNITGAIGYIGSALTGMFNSVVGAVQSFRGWVTRIVNWGLSRVGMAPQDPSRGGSKAAPAPGGFQVNSSFGFDWGNVMRSLPFGRSSGGFLPMDSPLGALLKEGLNAPSGSYPIIANTAEAVLNRPQQELLASLIGGSVNRPAVTAQAQQPIFSPNVTVNVPGGSSSSADEIGQTVVEVLSNLYRRHLSTVMPAG